MRRFAKSALAFLLSAALLILPALAFGPEESDVFYEQLSDYAKGIYQAMNRADVLECMRNGTSFDLTFDGPFGDFQETSQMLFQANSYAFSAFELNHPEMFWLSGNSAKTSGSTSRITMTVTPTFASNWAGGGRSTAVDAAAVDAAVKQIAAEARAQGGAYAQLLYAHDWLTTHNVYNSAAASVGPAGAVDGYLPWTPLAALTDTFQPVCEGYSKAFKLICDELGIPCVIVDGVANGGHEWNQVLLNGAWYAVDVTFDDPTVSGIYSVVSGYEYHDYFLVGAATPVKGYQTFADTHTPNGARLVGTSFFFPELAPYAFDPSEADEPVVPDEPDDPGEPDGPEDPVEPNEPDQPDDPEWPDSPPPLSFADVPETAYCFPAVRWAVLVGVTKGTGLDEQGRALFSPDATVTRAQAVTFLWRAMWEPEPQTAANPFTDVEPGAYYEKAVLWAVENGITNGTGTDTFSPDDPVTCSQMLTFLWRAMGKPEETEAYSGKSYYADAEGWASAYGIIGEAAYSAPAPCPRGDVICYLYSAKLYMAG